MYLIWFRNLFAQTDIFRLNSTVQIPTFPLHVKIYFNKLFQHFTSKLALFFYRIKLSYLSTDWILWRLYFLLNIQGIGLYWCHYSPVVYQSCTLVKTRTQAVISILSLIHVCIHSLSQTKKYTNPKLLGGLSSEDLLTWG